MSDFITKNAPASVEEKRRPDFVQGQRLASEVKFKPANEKELERIRQTFKAIGEELPEGYVAGWASTSNVDLYGHKVMPGAFSQSIREHGLSGPRGVKFLLSHDWEKIAGEIKVLEYRGDRLWMEAQMFLDISYVRDAYIAAKRLGGLNFSVGFSLQDYSFEKDDQSGDDILQITRGDLMEVSMVLFPGNEDCVMEFVKGRENSFTTVNTIADFEKALVAQGIAKNRTHAEKLTRAVKSCPHLFLKGEGEGPASTSSPNNTAPWMEPHLTTKLSDLISKMKAIAPAAS